MPIVIIKIKAIIFLSLLSRKYVINIIILNSTQMPWIIKRIRLC
jgi:hypothetical protein